MGYLAVDTLNIPYSRSPLLQLAASDSVSELNVRDFVEPAAPQVHDNLPEPTYPSVLVRYRHGVKRFAFFAFQGLPFWSALLAVPAVFIAAVSLGRRAGSPRVLDPLNIDALPSNRVAMAGLFGNKQPGEQGMISCEPQHVEVTRKVSPPPFHCSAVPSMAEMSKAIESLGGPAALQEAAKSLSTETLKEMAEITKQVRIRLLFHGVQNQHGHWQQFPGCTSTEIVGPATASLKWHPAPSKFVWGGLWRSACVHLDSCRPNSFPPLQMVSKGPESLTLQQQQVMIKVQMEMLTVLKVFPSACFRQTLTALLSTKHTAQQTAQVSKPLLHKTIFPRTTFVSKLSARSLFERFVRLRAFSMAR